MRALNTARQRLEYKATVDIEWVRATPLPFREQVAQRHTAAQDTKPDSTNDLLALLPDWARADAASRSRKLVEKLKAQINRVSQTDG